jgi:CoA:oxalate CoA-transferase
MLAGPYCGMLLADLGAEVVKIETGLGDIARSAGRHNVGEHNVYFASLNRNKRSILLDLTQEDDWADFETLVRNSHALITNLRPRAIHKLGLTYDRLKSLNPKLTCVALTGFGLTGPYSSLPAYDYIIQAMTGVMMLTGEPGAPPVRAGYSVADNTGGMMAAIGLLASLVGNHGGQVDVSLYDTLLSQLNYLAAAYLNAGEVPERHASGAHSFFVPAQIFRTNDGHIALFITHDNFWSLFAEVAGRPDWITDARFATMVGRSRHRDIVIESVQSELLKRSSADWMEALRPLGVVIASVGSLEEALSEDNVIARDMVVSIPTEAGQLRVIGNPIKIEGFTGEFRAPPRLGADRGILTESR